MSRAIDRPTCALAEGSAASLVNAGMSGIDCLAIIYLAVPVALFFVTWLTPALAILSGIAALAGVFALRGSFVWNMPGRNIGFCVVVALLWASLSGAGHFFYAGDASNWPVRDAVLHDLVVWPGAVVYAQHEGVVTLLRAPVGYYMVPAIIARLTGLGSAPALHYLWTAVGVLLFLLLVIPRTRGWLPLFLTAIVVVLFGGMEILAPPEMVKTQTGEWHAAFYQSSFNSALLIFSPNHGIPGWLAMTVLYRCRNDPAFLRIAAWFGSLTLVWAPLVSIGLLPFFLAETYRAFRRGNWRVLFSGYNLIAAPLIAIPAFIYLTAAADTIKTSGASAPDWQAFLAVYLPITSLEFGALALALVYACKSVVDRPFMAIAVLLLLVLPLFRFGPNSDLVARGGIPALTVLILTVIDGWSAPVKVGGRGLTVTAILAIGAILPLVTIFLVITTPRWARHLDRSLYSVTAGQSPNYLATIPTGSLLGKMLRLTTENGAAASP